MKKLYTFKTFLTLNLIACFTFITNAQIRIVEVDPATDQVKIRNFGGGTINISTYELCAFPNYAAMSSMNVTDGDLNLENNTEVTVTLTGGIATKVVPLDGELGLYINDSNFGDFNNMVDYMQWGTSGHFRESVAANPSLNIWTAGTTITVTPPYQYSGDGSQNGVTNWVTLSAEDFSINSFSISPNPSRESIQLQFPTSIRNASIQVYDILGKQTYTNKDIVGRSINISQWNNGMYLVKVSANGNTKTKRFVKQ